MSRRIAQWAVAMAAFTAAVGNAALGARSDHSQASAGNAVRGDLALYACCAEKWPIYTRPGSTVTVTWALHSDWIGPLIPQRQSLVLYGPHASRDDLGAFIIGFGPGYRPGDSTRSGELQPQPAALSQRVIADGADGSPVRQHFSLPDLKPGWYDVRSVLTFEAGHGQEQTVGALKVLKAGEEPPKKKRTERD